jgi:diacylglycerol kinase family enzyme
VGRIAVIVNPHAKDNRTHPERAARLAEIVGDLGTVVETSDVRDLRTVAREVLAADPELICLCGGDGTLHLALTELVPRARELGRAAGDPLPPLHFLRGGSMNTNAWGLGLRCPPEKALAKIAEARRASALLPTVRVGTIAVDGRFGFIYGAGYVVHFLDEYYAAHVDSGPRRAMEITYKAATAVLTGGDFLDRLARHLTGRVTVDGEALALPSIGMVLAGSTEYLGIGFKSLYRARERAGSFHVVATVLAPIKILTQVHRFFVGKPLTGEGHYDRTARELRVSTDDVERYQLDGEIYEARDLTITPGPAIEVVVA